MKKMQEPMRGFTLVELMIVVVIVGVLASIAYPSYVESIRSARRSDAKAVLGQAAQFMERNYTLSQRYDKKSSGDSVSLPESLTQSPSSGSAYYSIAISSVDQNAFTVTATPQGDQSSDKCGKLSLDNAGTKSAATSGCW